MVPSVPRPKLLALHLHKLRRRRWNAIFAMDRRERNTKSKQLVNVLNGISVKLTSDCKSELTIYRCLQMYSDVPLHTNRHHETSTDVYCTYFVSRTKMKQRLATICLPTSFPIFFACLTISCNSQPHDQNNKPTANVRQNDNANKKPAISQIERETEKTKVVANDPSIIIAPWRNGNGVENGDVFDKSIIKVGAYRKIVLPDTAILRHDGEGEAIQIYMKKTLSFGGWPPASMPIREVRKNMGCAFQDEKGVLILATFGEWNSHREGSALMKLVIVVPKTVEVEKRPSLAGEDSIASTWRKVDIGKERERYNGFWWYGPPYPGDGWKELNAIPDNERRAETVSTPPGT